MVALTALAAVLRFATLDVQSIWLDESATIVLVRRGFMGMLSHLASSESTPPLYYVLVWTWTKVFGVGPIGFRSFSALIGTLTVPALYLAGREISPRVGLWAATLGVVSPVTFYYSQEARAYGLLILFSAVAFALWQRALRSEHRRTLALWAGVSCLAVFSHYFAVFLFIPEAVVLIRRLGAARVRVPIGAVVVAGLAVAPLAVAQRSDGKGSWIEGESLPSRIAESIKQFLVGLYGPLELFTALIAGLLVLGAVALIVKRADERERARARAAAIVALAGLAIPLALALAHIIDIFDGRNVIGAWAPAAVFVAVGLGAQRSGRAGALLGAGLCAISLAVIAGTELIPAYQRDDWHGAAQALGAPTRPRVIVTEHLGSVPLSIYIGAVSGMNARSVATSELDFVGLRVRRTTSSPTSPVVPITPPAGFRLAAIYRAEAYAVSRFTAPRPRAVSRATLERMRGETEADIVTQR